MRGQQLKPFRGPTGEVEMLMQFRAEDRRNLDRLMQVPIKSPGGELVSLGALADWRIKPITGTIRRDNRATAVSVKAALQDISSSEARKRIEAAMKQLDLPSGYGWRLGRSFDEEEHSEEVMAINMLLALAMIYIVMAALFESLLFPLSIITTIFFSFLGAYWFFGITGTAFTIMAAIGLLILMGIVVNNGIVLIDHVNHLRWSGLDRREAILQGARDRMRPILMTAGTTVLGLVPLALGGAQIGGNGPPYFPMARAIMGGLLFSTVATLLLLPALYTLLDDLRDWSAREAGGRLRAMRSWFRPAVRG
jgi:HAE1 family hydrophobic/amphiphilic exporter-1